MKPGILIIQWIVILLASGGGGDSIGTANWACYELAFGPGVDSHWDGLPPVDEPVMFGRLALPTDQLPKDGLQSVEGRIRLEPEENHEYLHRRRGQHQVRIYSGSDQRVYIEVPGITSHNMLTLSQHDGTYASARFSGRWDDIFGWGRPKTGAFTAEWVPAYSLSNCMSMK